MLRIITTICIFSISLESLALSFSDTDLSYYRDSIETLASEGIIS